MNYLIYEQLLTVQQWRDLWQSYGALWHSVTWLAGDVPSFH